MDLFVWLMVIGFVAVVIKTIVWVMAMGKVVEAAQQAQRVSGGRPADFESDFMAAMQLIQQLIVQAQHYQPPGSGIRGLPPAIQSQFQAEMLRAQNNLTQMDRLSRERCELNRASMLSSAASAGIDVSGW